MKIEVVACYDSTFASLVLTQVPRLVEFKERLALAFSISEPFDSMVLYSHDERRIAHSDDLARLIQVSKADKIISIRVEVSHDIRSVDLNSDSEEYDLVSNPDISECSSTTSNPDIEAVPAPLFQQRDVIAPCADYPYIAYEPCIRPDADELTPLLQVVEMVDKGCSATPTLVDSGIQNVKQSAIAFTCTAATETREASCSTVKKPINEQNLPSPVEHSPQPQESFQDYLVEIQRMTDKLLDKIESQPHFIPHLLEQLGDRFRSRNWSVSIESIPRPRHISIDIPAEGPRTYAEICGKAGPPSANSKSIPFVASAQSEGILWNICCDGCHDRIRGTRYKCDYCPEYSLCQVWIEYLCQSCFVNSRIEEPLHPAAHTFTGLVNPNLVWTNVTCDGCQVRGFATDRYKCLSCLDFDYCEPCFLKFERGELEHTDNDHAFECRGSPPAVWSGVTCDACQHRGFRGSRFKCQSCADFDLCSECHEKGEFCEPDHEFCRLDSNLDLWGSSICDGCNAYCFAGVRNRCAVCPDYDLCQRCFARYQDGNLVGCCSQARHPFLTMYPPSHKKFLVKEQVKELGFCGFDDKYVDTLYEENGGDIGRIVQCFLERDNDHTD